MENTLEKFREFLEDDYLIITAKEARELTTTSINMRARLYNDVVLAASMGKNRIFVGFNEVSEDVEKSIIDEFRSNGFIFEKYDGELTHKDRNSYAKNKLRDALYYMSW